MPAPMEPAERRVLDYLFEHCRGRDAAQTQQQLADALGMSRREIHDLITRLVTCHNQPICASCSPPYGHYWATTPQELSEYAERLLHRMIELWLRICALRRPDAPGLDRQLRLFASERLRVATNEPAARKILEILEPSDPSDPSDLPIGAAP